VEHPWRWWWGAYLAARGRGPLTKKDASERDNNPVRQQRPVAVAGEPTPRRNSPPSPRKNHQRSLVLGLDKEGVIGKPLMVKAINNQRRGTLPHRENSEVPANVDYDLWLGPAPHRPFNRNHFHSSWHWMWNYGTGDLGNDGVHQIDLGRWALGLKAPNTVSCSGAKLGSRGDAQETPDSMVVTWEYDDLLYVFEQRDFTPYRQQGHRLDNDNIIFGDKGYMMVDRDGYRVFYKNEAGPSLKSSWTDSPTHYQNFIDCIKSRQREELIADIEEGHYSALLCHLGNIAYRTGRRLEFDAEKEVFLNDEQANNLLGREYRKGYELPKV